MPIGQQMSIGQMLQSANPLAVYEAQSNYQKAQGKQNKTDRFAEGNYSALGGIGMAAKLLGGYLSGKHGKATDSAQADLIKAQFEDFQEQSAMADQKKAQAQREKYRREDKVSNQKHLNSMELKASGQQGTSLERNLEAMGLQKGSPKFVQAMQQQLNKSNSPTVNIDNGKTQGAFTQALAKGNATKYNEWESAAYASNEILGKLGQMEQISNAQQTGKMNEAMAMAGQWFGTDAGSNLQSYNAIQKDLMLDAASNLKGAMSDGEWRVLQAKMPDFGNDPNANNTIMSLLKGAAQRTINRYDQASDFVSENGKLQGFKPESGFSNSNKSQQKPETKKQGGKLMVDANGNKAMVYPDGTFEEQ